MSEQHAVRRIAVIAVAENGNTYRIERQGRQSGDGAPASVACCLPDGQQVDRLDRGLYRLPDGTVVKTRRAFKA